LLEAGRWLLDQVSSFELQLPVREDPTLQAFDYIIPRDHAEASALLAQGTGVARAFMGGTDLLIRIRGGLVSAERVVDVKHLPGMREIGQSRDGWLVIGAACTMNQVAGHPTVQAHYSLLAQACNSVASYQLRNRATLGGNICNASPAADTAPALYCLDAGVELFGSDGARRVPIAEFFLGPGKTALRPDEFLIAIHLPPAPAGAHSIFSKLGRTKIGDISMVSVAVLVDFGLQISDLGLLEARTMGSPALLRSGDFSPQSPIRNIRIALGAVGPTPLRAFEAEIALAEDASPEGVKRAAELAAAAAQPIDDIRASAAYRRAMVAVLARRGIEAVLADSPSSDLRLPTSTGGGA
jgi:CO/xanthine dehydrogenase FAD-binding subunit